MLDRERVQLDLEAVAADLSDEVSEESERAQIERQIADRPSETQEETFRLYRQGLSVSQIAAQRELKVSTIELHLSALLADGRAIKLDDLIDPTDRALIEVAIDRCQQAGQVGLSPIKSELPEHIGYGAIRMVMAAKGKQP
jgi:ATP-dependent DNA helicase RecQ